MACDTRFLAPYLPPCHVPTLFVLRGVSGSGKSQVARALAAAREDSVVVSTDAFFTSKDGAYRFDPGLLPAAHASCRAALDAALAERHRTVIVDNTHTAHWEWSRCYEAAVASSYGCFVIEIVVPDGAALALCASRCVHGVPWHTLLRQWLRFEPFPPALQLPMHVSDPPAALDAEGTARALEADLAAAALQSAPTTMAALSSPQAPLPSSPLRPPMRFVIELPRRLRCAIEFVALFLYPGSRAQLLAAIPPPASHELIAAEHCTLAHAAHGREGFREVSPALLSLIGLPVRLITRSAATNGAVVAVPVSWPEGEDEVEQQQQLQLPVPCDEPDAAGGAGEDGDVWRGREDAGADKTHIVRRAVSQLVSSSGGGAPAHALGCNRVPHITISLAPGVSARLSNAMLEDEATLHHHLPEPLVLWARLGVAVFDPTAKGLPPAATRRFITTASAWTAWAASIAAQEEGALDGSHSYQTESAASAAMRSGSERMGTHTRFT